MTIDNLTFLEEGEFTRIDDTVREYARGIAELGGNKGNVNRFLSACHEFLGGFRYESAYKSQEFRKRTASQILNSGHYTGCTDVALAFLAVARSAGIPAKYVETFDEEWLAKRELPIEGHVFAEIYDAESRKWIKVNPPSEQTNDFELLIRREFRRYVEAGAGVDFGSIYVKKNGVYLPEARRVQSIDEIMKVAEEIGESK